MLSRLKENKKIKRLIARGEPISNSKIRQFWFPEMINKIGSVFTRLGLNSLSQRIAILSLGFYGLLAALEIRSFHHKAKVYHYRAGFGGASVRRAKTLGMIALCDHSIVHPALMTYLIEQEGKMPTESTVLLIDPFWKKVLEDIKQADAVLVNSEFVAESFKVFGWRPDTLHTIYWGVDDQFFKNMPSSKRLADRNGPLKLIFAGSFERRKGAETVISALTRLNTFPWELEIAGSIDSALIKRHLSFFKRPEVKWLGVLPRCELASHMARAEIFVFPSLAEGSARVVFEALATGCFIITTENSGSVIADGVHGFLVPPGNAEALLKAIRSAWSQRDKLYEIGLKNRELVFGRYRQQHYGEALANLYERLIENESNRHYPEK